MRLGRRGGQVEAGPGLSAHWDQLMVPFWVIRAQVTPWQLQRPWCPVPDSSSPVSLPALAPSPTLPHCLLPGSLWLPWPQPPGLSWPLGLTDPPPIYIIANSWSPDPCDTHGPISDPRAPHDPLPRLGQPYSSPILDAHSSTSATEGPSLPTALSP